MTVLSNQLNTPNSLVVNEMFKQKILTDASMERKCDLFKHKLYGSDKRSWMPNLKADSFKDKVVTMCFVSLICELNYATQLT